MEMEMQEGFSIREYALRMRSVNVTKCWPLDETTNEETIKSLLPPISVRKFTWWLEYLHSVSAKNVYNSKRKMIETTLINEEDVDVEGSDDSDNDVEEAMGVGNVKPLKAKGKKRSIVEIERVNSDHDDSARAQRENGVFNSKYSSNGEINWGLKRKRNNQKKTIKNNKAIIINRLKIKVKRVIKKINKTQKRDSEMDLSITHKESRFKFKARSQEKDIGCLRSSFTKEFDNNVCNFMPIQKRNPRLQNLNAHKKNKNDAKTFSLQQSMKCTLQEAIQVSHCSTEKAKKHVAFYDKDEILGSDDISNRTENEQLTRCITDSTTFRKQNNEHGHFSTVVASDRNILHHINQHLFDSRLREVAHNPMYAAPLEGYYNSPNVNVMRNNSSNSTHKRIIKDLLQTPDQSIMAKRTNKLPQAFSERYLNLCILQDENWGRNSSGKSSINEDFCGLPLNSQGELVTLNSSAKRDFNQMMKSSETTAPSISSFISSNALLQSSTNDSECRCWDYQTSLQDQLNMFSYVRDNHGVVIPSRLEKTNSDFDLAKKNSRHYFHYSENSVCKEDNYQVEESPGNEKIQSTMRLMGKEFIVGERVSQGFEDGHNSCKDKHIIGGNVMVHDQKLRETFLHPANHISESMYTVPHFDCQTSSMYHQNVFVARENDHVQKLCPGLPPVTFSAVYSSESLFPEPFTNGYESRLHNLHRAPRSAIRFPFVHPDFEGHFQSSLNQPPLMYCDVSEARTLSRNSQSYLKPKAFSSMYSPFSSASTMHSSSIAPTPMSQHTVTPCYPGVLSVSALHKRNLNQKKIKEHIRSRIELDHGKKAKKQPPSTLSNVSFNPLKTNGLGFQQGFQCANFEGRVPNIERAFESEILMSGEYGAADKDEERIYTWMDSDGITGRKGPTKLTAGAKLHILKASQQIDQSVSRFSDTKSPVFKS